MRLRARKKTGKRGFPAGIARKKYRSHPGTDDRKVQLNISRGMGTVYFSESIIQWNFELKTAIYSIAPR